MTDLNSAHNDPLVMFVDDDATVLYLAEQYLTRAGFRVKTADRGRAALENLDILNPDIILLDVQMPEMGGFEACESIRKRPKTMHTPILMVTGLDDYESIHQAYESGATDFFTKPINWLILEHRIRYVLRLSKSEEDLRVAREELERRVEERTRDLKRTNLELQDEIQQRKLAETSQQEAYDTLKSTQAQLVQSAKLASIGELAAGVVHELNQPLMVIRGYAQTLVRHPIDGPNTEKWLKLIERNTGRMTNIINHLRVFSRQSQSEFTWLEINKIIEEAFLMISEQLRLHEIESETNLSPDVPKIKGDTNKLEQVILNLITNARDAIEEQRTAPGESHTPDVEERVNKLEISTRFCENGEPHIEVLVKDTGCGIPADIKNNIFDPFFTTKAEGKGTGLGLSISYGIIKEHQADIEIADTGPDGTTFRLKFPVAPPQ